MKLRAVVKGPIGTLAGIAVLTMASFGWAQAPDGRLLVPASASSLEGQPTIRLDVTIEGATRKALDRKQAASEALTIKIVDGRYYWTSRGDQPLTLISSGGFIYLMSSEPGKYVRFKQINDRLTYVEHVDTDFGSVTYWGELRILLGKSVRIP